MKIVCPQKNPFGFSEVDTVFSFFLAIVTKMFIPSFNVKSIYYVPNTEDTVLAFC